MSPADQYAPSFVIEVDGKDLRDVGADVLSLSITDTCDRADSFSFSVRDRHPKPARFAGGPELKWMDDQLLQEGRQVKIRMGYVNNLGIELWGLITGVSASFPESGMPTLTVRGYSFYWKLQHQRRDKPFKAATDSGIAKECATDLGLKAVVDETTVQHPLVSSNNATYAALLTQRAQRIGYEVFVKKDTLYFQKARYRDNPGPELTLEWGRDLRSFSPNLSLHEMATEVETRGPQTSLGRGKTALVGKAGAGSEQAKMGAKTGSQIAQAAGVSQRVIVEDHNIPSQEEANQLALAQLETRSLNLITGRGSCIGSPQLTARTVIELKGLGKCFSGNYYVTSATHAMDTGGYRTDFEVKRNGR